MARPKKTTVTEIHQTVEELARVGAQRVLQKALEEEVEEHLSRDGKLRDEDGR